MKQYLKIILYISLFSSISFSNDILDIYQKDSNTNIVKEENIRGINTSPSLDFQMCTMEIRMVFRINPKTNDCEMISLSDGCIISDFFNGKHKSSFWKECAN